MNPTDVKQKRNERDEHEPLLQPIDNKYLFTAKLEEHMDVYDLYQKQQSAIWFPGEVDYSGDRQAYLKMNKQEQHFFSHILAFFAGADLMVVENIQSRFIDDVGHIPIIQTTYTFQAMMENIHSEAYNILLTSMIPDKQEQDRLLNAVKTMPCITRKMEFGDKYQKCNCPFAMRLYAYLLFEGVFFSGSFCAIFWNKSRGGSLGGLISANEFISRDEGLHCTFAVMLYKKLKYRLSQAEIEAMTKQAVEIETQFICESIPVSMIGMNASTMTQYIHFVSDYWIKQLGHEPIYNVENPFNFMESISLDTKVNFFEARNTFYAKAETEHTFNCEEDDF